MASSIDEFKRRSNIVGQGYNKGGMKGANGFFQNVYNKAKDVNNYLRNSKIISRSTGFVLNNPVTSAMLNLAPKSAVDVLQKVHSVSKKYGYGTMKKKTNKKK